jgi:hypothetical protein
MKLNREVIPLKVTSNALIFNSKTANVQTTEVDAELASVNTGA